MKKILTLHTGLAILITILIAFGCNRGKLQVRGADDEIILSDSAFASLIIADDPTKHYISVEDTFYAGRFHLIMQNYDSKGVQGKKVIDNLETVVDPGHTVYWNKTSRSDIKKVNFIRIVDPKPWSLIDSCLIGLESEETLDRGSVKFIIPSDADSGTVKYEIVFTIKDDSDAHKKKTWCIDPHLRIPPK
jgi:hypothetical protein